MNKTKTVTNELFLRYQVFVGQLDANWMCPSLEQKKRTKNKYILTMSTANETPELTNTPTDSEPDGAHNATTDGAEGVLVDARDEADDTTAPAGDDTGEVRECTSEPPEEAPPLPEVKEEPMPTDDECFERHLGDKLLALLRDQPTATQEALFRTFTVKMMAVDVELSLRALKPHEKNLRVMQSIAQRFKTKKELETWKTTNKRFLVKYKNAENEYLEKMEELKSTVRTFIHEQIDKEQRARIETLRRCKPLSKGRRKHFWEALSTDNVDKLKRTLETVDDVACASHSIQHTKHTENPRVALLCACVDKHRSMPENGAHASLRFLLTTYRDFFSNKDVESVRQHIEDAGWGDIREQCGAVLADALAS